MTAIYVSPSPWVRDALTPDELAVLRDMAKGQTPRRCVATLKLLATKPGGPFSANLSFRDRSIPGASAVAPTPQEAIARVLEGMAA